MRLMLIVANRCFIRSGNQPLEPRQNNLSNSEKYSEPCQGVRHECT